MIALALVSSLIAVILARAVFPFMSINNDEPINRLFADAIAHGHLFPPTLGLPDAFRPWLAAVGDGHYVLKYTPVVPAMMAVSMALTGGTTLYLAVLAAAMVLMTYLLAIELLGDRRESLVTTALVALSPLVMIQSALLLSYMPTLLLFEVFAWALVRGLRSGTARLLSLSGLAFGLAFFARSYDALVLAVPFGLWALLGRYGRRPRLRDGVSFAVPALAAVACFLIFNQAATGDPLTPPFSLLEPQDKLGFGVRKLYPEDVPRQFGLRQGISGVLRHGFLLNYWVSGGTILLLLAGTTLARRRVEPPSWPVIATAFLLPLSYIGFWGPWNATVLWGGPRYIGPFYFLPVVLPVGFLAARGLMDLHRWRPWAAVGLAAAIAAVTCGTLASSVRDNLSFTADQRALYDLVGGRGSRQLVFAAMPTPYLMHPPAVISNRWDLSGPVVYALEQGPSNLEVAGRFPDRTPYRLEFNGDFSNPGRPFSARLEELRHLQGEVFELRLQTPQPPAAGSLTLVISALGVTRRYDLGAAGAPVDERILIDRQGARMTGRSPEQETAQAGSAELEVELFVRAGEGEPAVSTGRANLPVGFTSRRLTTLVPTGRTWTTGPAQVPPITLTAGR